ncbi:phage tail fiber protein [Escherichia coli]|uniref:tail fiber domain-containing protein n=1 Tax=Escherichia coli TaxID=562 RepID=UPI000E2A5664|nr:tail fiber domain-containing protein [Escherichia coli]QMB20039.1 tail fiber domain-containing protein [Escherichia coli]SVF28749.1 phage tail fiber protein [Escherichia coli]HBJ0060180.1 tail fiber domain-containing protein [Escherichia coli]HBJ0284299.1 tail fiber domain-containing protein [Escherichia coli]HBJ0289546.1 tail fiber domain-containing protein [Escherichia coli]
MQSIQFKRTNVSGKKPTPEQLQVGEVAINLKDHVIFTKDRDHEVVQISVSPETHAALESKVDANKQELDSTIAVNDRNIHAKVDEIKQTTDATIAANHAEINNKVDVIKRETDATIEANKNKAASDLAGVKAELSDTINANKNAAAVATQELDTRINKKVDDIKSRTDATIASNDKAINDKVDLIKAETDRTIAANKVYAENQLTDTYNNLTGVIAANKQEAADNVAALTRDVEAKNTAIHSKVDNNKSYTDSELARLESRIDAADGSSDGKYIKKHVNTYTDGYLLSKTANYFDDPNARNLDYFGAFRMNDLAGHIAMILHVPHPSGVNHARGFEFTYGSNPHATVRTYGYDELGNLSYSHRMYHEGDKPTPAEIGAYSKAEIDRMFQKTINFGVETGWFKIATAFIPQNDGRSLKIRLIGGNGWNVGQTGQCNIIELVIRTSNGSPKGINFVAYHHVSGYENQFCAINTSDDTYDIYAYYFEFTNMVMAEYQASTGVNLTVLDRPEYVGEKPVADHIYDAYTIHSFNSFSNRGTLNFAGNHQGQYDIEHMNEQPTNAKKMLRRFRSSAPATIWHESVDDQNYRLATGYTDVTQQLLLSAVTGLHIRRLTIDGGLGPGSNAGIDIRRGPNEASHFNFMDYRTGQDVRNGWFGFGDLTTKDFIWWNDNGQNSINLIENGELHITGGKGQKIVMNSEVALSENARLAVKGGNYGLIFRNDGTSFHILTTDLKDSFGNWNNRRPFSYDFADGGLYLGGTETARCLHLGIDGSTRLEDNLFFKSGSRQSMDYMELVHWGASNTGRNNVLSLRDSKGFLAEFERTGNNSIKTRFFGETFTDGTLYLNQMNNSSERFSINNWGNSEVGRAAVLEIGDSQGYHFYTERRTDNSLVFDVSGALTVRGPNGITIKNSTGARHIWFRDDSETEKAVIWATDDGILHIRNNHGGPFTHHFQGAMIKLEGRVPYAADQGLIRGEVSGGAYVAWRDRPAGLLVDCQQSVDSAHAIWKAVDWGRNYIAAMDVHCPGDSNNTAAAVLHVQGADYQFHASGEFHATGNGNFNDVYIRSDRRLKINVEDYEENAVDKVNKLKVKTYDKVKSLSDREVIAHEIGIIAQDLQEVLPEAVKTAKIGGLDNPEEILTISNSAVNALLIKAVQEMSEENKLLRERLAAIEAKLFG